MLAQRDCDSRDSTRHQRVGVSIPRTLRSKRRNHVDPEESAEDPAARLRWPMQATASLRFPSAATSVVAAQRTPSDSNTKESLITAG